MASGKVTLGRGLSALVLLVAVAGGSVFLVAERGRTTPTEAPLAPDTVQVMSAPPAGAPAAPLLGMGSDVSDDLDPAYLPGSSIASTLEAIHLPLLRFGDLAADSYDWMTDCSYGNDGRVPECDVGAGSGSSFDHFLQFVGKVGATPLIVVNGEIDDPQQAARMVSYYLGHCLRAPPTQAGATTACKQPLWEIGFSPANWRHFAIPLADRRPDDASVIQPDQYAALVISYAAAMQQAAPPSEHLRIVADEWITGATDQSWVAHVSVVDTHYAPLQYVPGSALPSVDQVARSPLQGFAGRPGIDAWLEDLRSSLAQFTNSDGIGIIVGQWTIDANTSLNEPAMYGGYLQAVFAAALIADIWDIAAAGVVNPVTAIVQYPIIGSSQEPFDPATGSSRPALQVYKLVEDYFGATILPVAVSDQLTAAGLVAAASAPKNGQAGLLLVNTNDHQALNVRVAGLAPGSWQLHVLTEDGAGNTRVSAHTEQTRDGRITLPPWGIAMIQAAAAKQPVPAGAARPRR